MLLPGTVIEVGPSGCSRSREHALESLPLFDELRDAALARALDATSAMPVRALSRQ